MTSSRSKAMIPPWPIPPPPWYASPKINLPTMRRLTLSCTNVSFMPCSFAPPQPKHLFAGFGAKLIVSVKFRQPLRFFVSSFLLYCPTSFLLLTPVQRGFFPHAARRAAACASRHAEDPPASEHRVRFAFHPSPHSQDAACLEADSARRNNGPAQREPHALWRGSRARWRQIPEAVPATNTFRRRAASSACPRAYVCEAPRPKPRAAKHKLCAF